MFFLKHLKLPQKCRKHSGRSKTTSRLGNSNGAMRINLTQLDNGESAKVIELCNNNEIKSKLTAMGIISGAVIRKKSALLAKGPIVIEKEFEQYAIGYAMAQKIIVEPLNMDLRNNR